MPFAKYLAAAALALALTAGLAPAPADDVITKWEDPGKERLTDCESWKNDWEIRCLSQGGAAAIGGTVTLVNPGHETVVYATQVWKSACGFPSSGPEAKAEWLLPPGGVQDIKLDSNVVGVGTNSGCTELFVFDCKVGGVATPCRKRLQATLMEHTVWPAQPPRDCELQHGTTFYCLSWSLKNGATYIPGPVQLQRTDSSKDLLVVRPVEWQSVCGSVGTQNKQEPVYLPAGQGQAISFKGYTGDFANWGDLCVEMFIGYCTLSADGQTPQQVNCADHLHVTVQ